MATVSSTLKMFDAMSGPLRSITQSMNLMLSAMTQIQSAANQNANIDEALATASNSLVSAETDIVRVIEQNAAAQENLNIKAGQQPEVKIPDIQQPSISQKLPSAIPTQSETPAWGSAKNVELFKTSGVDRLKSEMLDAHNMISKLQAEQAGISIRARSMDIVPPEARKDIESAYQRMRAIYNEMEGIAGKKNILKGKLDPSEANRLNSAYETLRQELNSAIGAQQSLNAAMKQGDISKVNSAYKQLVNNVDSVDRHIRDNMGVQNQFNQSVSKGAGSGLWNKIKSMGAGAASWAIQGVKKGAEITDTYISTQARLNTINDGTQTTDQLQNKIFNSANRSRVDYNTMAANVSNLGLTAGDAFSNNNEIISFTELMQKSFKASGTSATEQQSGMYQLTQAMASGKLQGDEFQSIVENAPMLADAIAKFTGKSKEDLKKMSAEGVITSDIIKNAIFKSADDINSKFNSMPMTFDEAMIGIENKALQAFVPVMEKVSGALNSPIGQAFVQNISNAIAYAALMIDGLVEALLWVGNTVQQNWGIIEPILATIGAALALWGITQIPMLTAKLWDMVKPIAVAAVKFLILNWPVLLIGAAIGFLLYAMVKWGDTTVEVIGVIFGAFAAFGAFLWNLFLGILDIVLGVINLMVNPFIRFANFMANIFTSPKSAIIYTFQGMADTVLGILQKIASVLDFIFGSKMADTVSNWRSGIKNMADEAVKKYAPEENYKKVVDELELSVDGLGLKRLEYGDTYNKGKEVGKSAGQYAVDGVQNAFNSLGTMFKNPLGSSGESGEASILPADINKVGEVGKIGSTVDISSEDLKTMRELAEMKNIQNFVRLTPTVRVQTGDIKNGYDIDTIIARITNELETQIVSSAEGVYST